ncbi:MAG: 23S rRNA (pseudouridine(1915)-N(3))-methyltransferase RlmH [Thermodesulfobacterium sp.]|nr:23S rRNA (pseudouridine(1915)-N(3))-methyltransferase RlmH [Thermodesulfobacterium sp.]
MLKKIKILMPGPVKFKFVKEGLEYYLEKIEPFVSVDTIFPKIKAKVSDASIKVKKEEEAIKKYIIDKDYLVVLDERGRTFKSLELAEKLKILMQNQSYITFVIGGPEGISENLKKTAREVWSLSTLTLNHEIALLVFVEALYRSFTVIKGIPYHRE